MSRRRDKEPGNPRIRSCMETRAACTRKLEPTSADSNPLSTFSSPHYGGVQRGNMDRPGALWLTGYGARKPDFELGPQGDARPQVAGDRVGGHPPRPLR